MTLIIEDGTGIYEANAYAGKNFVRNYLKARNRNTVWDATSNAVKEAAIIAATDYIDRRFGPVFLGQKQYLDITVAASNILVIGVLPSANDTITIGDVTYTFKASAAVANEVTIGATIADAVAALVAAMEGTGGGSGTVVHPTASPTVLESSGTILVRALVAGVLADPIPTSASNSSHVWDYEELNGGIDSTEQILEFPRDYLYTKTGVQIIGIPERLKQAVAEYAERAVTDDLMPDPEVEATGGMVTLSRDKVGPIETERRYSGSFLTIYKKYPSADKLLSNFITSFGGVIR